jgi:hypothetical protein
MMERVARKDSQMPARSRKKELAIRRQEAGTGYKVALRLTSVAAIAGGFVSMVAFHAPLYLGGKLGFLLGGWLIVLIYGGPGFAPFAALYLILRYHPPQKKVLDEQPTTSGAPATDAHNASTTVRCLYCQHVQTVPISQPTFVCEQCKARS